MSGWRWCGLVLLLGLVSGYAWLLASESPAAPADPYLPWAQGRPQESLPWLWQRAEVTDSWHQWYDAGLCAAASDQQPRAIQALLRAHQQAPWRQEPGQALATLDVEPLPQYLRHYLGPLARFGDGWIAVLLALTAGLAGGWALTGPRARAGAGTLAVIAALLLLPALLARTIDAQRQWAVLAIATQLVDAAGNPQQSLAAGTVVELLDQEPRYGRRRVRIDHEQLGLLPHSLLLPVSATRPQQQAATPGDR